MSENVNRILLQNGMIFRKLSAHPFFSAAFALFDQHGEDVKKNPEGLQTMRNREGRVANDLFRDEVL